MRQAPAAVGAVVPVVTETEGPVSERSGQAFFIRPKCAMRHQDVVGGEGGSTLVAGLRGRYTIVAITHRPAWIEVATQLYKVERGGIAKTTGTRNDSFRRRHKLQMNLNKP